MTGQSKPTGFRRRFRIVPEAGRIRAAVEDDYHCMAVEIRHDKGAITAVTPIMDRAPWSTCSGAVSQLKTTFEGATLEQAAALGGKKLNCTHLYDLAVLCAAHAGDAAPTQYDIFTADPVEGWIATEILRNGVAQLRWEHENDVLCAPEELRGRSLFALREWIDGLEPGLREAARLLQWGTIIAHGRQIPLDRQNDARRMPPNCYTFQPENAVKAVRVGRIVDFSREPVEPLDHYDEQGFRTRA